MEDVQDEVAPSCLAEGECDVAVETCRTEERQLVNDFKDRILQLSE